MIDDLRQIAERLADDSADRGTREHAWHADKIEAALRSVHQSALTQQRQRDAQIAWRPIATAPKDGRTILAYFPTRKLWLAIQWSEWGGGVWDYAATSHHCSYGDEPTYWMPMLSAPAGADARASDSSAGPARA